MKRRKTKRRKADAAQSRIGAETMRREEEADETVRRKGSAMYGCARPPTSSSGCCAPRYCYRRGNVEEAVAQRPQNAHTPYLLAYWGTVSRRTQCPSHHPVAQILSKFQNNPAPFDANLPLDALLTSAIWRRFTIIRQPPPIAL